MTLGVITLLIVLLTGAVGTTLGALLGVVLGRKSTPSA